MVIKSPLLEMAAKLKQIRANQPKVTLKEVKEQLKRQEYNKRRLNDL